MKTKIELNENLIKEAIRLSGVHTNNEVINAALKYYIGHLKRSNMKALLGNVKWEGNLGQMRNA